MFVVPCTQCVFHGNKSNFNAGIYVIMTILNTNLGLSQISPQRMYRFDWVIFMTNSSKSHLILPTSLIYPFIPLIYHLFIFIYKISICFNLFLFALLTFVYILYLFLLHNLFSFTLIYLIYFTMFTLLISFIREFYCEPACSNYKIYWFLSDYLL